MHRLDSFLARGAQRAALVLAASSCLLPTVAAADAPNLELQLVTTGFARSVAVHSPEDGSGRLFVVEQGGLIRIWDGAQILPEPFLDLTDRVVCCNERGLLGLAFHPDFVDNGLFYVNYIEAEPEPPEDCSHPGGCDHNTVIARYQVSEKDPDLADPESATRILTVNQPNIQHNGGTVQFGPDGYLYIGMGDGNGADSSAAQPLETLLGKMLRLDVDGPPAGDCDEDANYAIPPDNPFVGPGSACDEIWVSGLRNPWKWSFDRLTGDIFIGDVGAGQREEVDFQAVSSLGGENYGWPCREGEIVRPPECLPGPLTDPILMYSHDFGGCTIIGGYRYRGSTMPEWDGAYFFADLCTTEISIAREEKGVWSVVGSLDVTDVLPAFWPISSFGEDENGELLLVSRNPGALYRLREPGVVFCDGFESGDTEQWEPAK